MGEEGELRWHDLSNVPSAGALINSPYDPEALYAQKRETSWIGYQVHVTETCDDQTPHLITHLETTPAPQADDEAILCIHTALAAHQLLPQKQLVDTGDVDAEELVSRRASVWRGAVRTDPRGLSVASAGRYWLAGLPVCGGLAAGVCHLSSRVDQEQLDARPGSAGQAGHQNQMCSPGLPTV